MAWYVVDGMDGSGKSTVAEMLRSGLESRGRRVMVLTHPSRDTRIGRTELRFLQKEGKAAMLCSTSLFILDILRSIRVMRGRRGRGYDDFVFVRYSMAAAYLPDRLCGIAYRIIVAVLLTPDTAILVDVDPQTAMDRIRGRGEEMEVFETVERLATVRRRMLSLSDGWTVLENGSGTDNLEEQVRGTLFGGSS